jgi:hypothetical protein
MKSRGSTRIHALWACNGEGYHVYGLRLEATSSGGFRILIPLVIKND